MTDNLKIDKHHELRARVILCREYSRALAGFHSITDGESRVIDYAARIVGHQAAIERLVEDLVPQPSATLVAG